MSRVALVVGINTYRYDDLRDLKAPAEDAEAIAQRLEKYGDFKVIRLPEKIDPDTRQPFVGKDARTELTFDHLEKALIELFTPDSKQAPDTAIFYFSGHGWLQEKGVRDGFLATSDTNLAGGIKGLSLRWLGDLLRASPISQQLILLDCCHSGSIIDFSGADIKGAGNVRDRSFIAASRDYQKSYQSLRKRESNIPIYSVFTEALLDIFDAPQSATKGLDSLELMSAIRKAMIDESLQTPICSIHGDPIQIIQQWDAIRPQPRQIINVDCPYKGLSYFDNNENDAKFFFGRDELIRRLRNHVLEKNFLALLGASGSGKSSLLRAGLLYQLQQWQNKLGGDRWELRVLLPTEHPLKSLAEAFVDPELGNIDRAAQLAKAEKLLAEGKEGLRLLVETSQAPRVVLVIDQFEESFTLCQNLEERERFFACLIGALGIAADKFCLVIAMRADFFGKCVEREYAGLAKRIEAHLVAVTPMNDAELREAIAKPAALVDCEVEPVLIEEIVQDVAGAPANLPLMQFALSELWQQRDGNRLTLQAYKQELGGITGALEKRANAVYAKFTDELNKRAVKHIFLSLTQLGEGTEDTRRRVVMSNLVTATLPLEAIERVVRKLADEKLVVTDDREKGKVSGDAIVDVAHEALIRGWKLLRGWLDEDRQNLRQQRWIEDRAIEWQGSGKMKEFLLSGNKLSEVQKFEEKLSYRFSLSELAQQLIKTSMHQRLKNLTLMLTVYLILSIALGLAFRSWYLETKWAILRQCQRIQTEEGQCEGRLEALRILIDSNVSLQSIDLTKANLSGADLSGAKLEKANLSKANLSKADLSRANLSEADLSQVNFFQADLSESDLTLTRLFSANLNGAKLFRANLFGSSLFGSKLIGSDLSITNLRKADLSFTNLTGANLTGADIISTNLELANLKEANLIDLFQSNPERIKTACNWQKSNMSEILREQIKKSPDPPPPPSLQGEKIVQGEIVRRRSPSCDELWNTAKSP